MTKELPETLSFRGFADLMHCKPSWVTHLRQTDRLVLTDDGKRVRVRESLQRIEDTRDPARAGVAQRHAQAREVKNNHILAEASPALSESNDAPPDTESDAVTAPIRESSNFQHWKERGERAKALAAERENAIAEGKLMSAEAVIDAVRAHVATLRIGLESMPDFLAPQLIGIKEELKMRSLIADAIEQKLAELSRQFGAIVKATV